MSEPLPRSAVVPGVLGGLSVVATTLLLEMGRSLVLNSFGETDAVRLVSAGLRWLAVLIVVLAVLYAGYRFAMERRARTRLVRRRSALAALDGTCSSGPGDGRVVVRPTADAVHRAWRNEVVAALRELPVWNYTPATLHAVLAAVAAVHGDLPGPLPPPFRIHGAREARPDGFGPGRPLGDPRTGPGLREWLEYGHILQRQGDRYLLVKVPESPQEQQVRTGGIWQAALFALLSYSADQASSWAVALTTVPFAPAARRWFTVEEKYLASLVLWCAPPAAGPDRTDTGNDDPGIPEATVVQMVRIADALDTWYAHKVRIGDDDEAAVVETLRRVTARSGMNWYMRSMELRQPRSRRPAGEQRPEPAGTGAQGQQAGEPVVPPAPTRQRNSAEPTDTRCGIRRRATGLAARWKHRAALEQLSAAGTPDDLADAVRLLRAAWWRLPREDVTNQVRVLANLAVVHIEQGRLDAAADRLELAAVRAAGEEDDAGRALVHELEGAVRWARGEPRGALGQWRRALTLYDDLGDDRGIAGCLHQIGSVLRMAPEHADLVLGDDPPPATEDVHRYARDWLNEAAARRAGTPPPRSERWPLRAGEPAISDRML